MHPGEQILCTASAYKKSFVSLPYRFHQRHQGMQQRHIVREIGDRLLPFLSPSINFSDSGDCQVAYLSKENIFMHPGDQTDFMHSFRL